jgi:hypothetical protein
MITFIDEGVEVIVYEPTDRHQDVAKPPLASRD